MLARFIENGDFERHVNRMRSHYRSVRDELVEALTNSPLGSRVTIEGADAGLHFLLCFESLASEAALVAAARREGVALRSLSSFYRRSPNRLAIKEGSPVEAHRGTLHRFLVSYAGLNRSGIKPAAQALVRAWA